MSFNLKIGPEIKGVLRQCITAGRPFLLEGTMGIGKSEIINEVAKDMRIACTVRDLSIMEAPDLSGLPIVSDKTMTYVPPSFLPQTGTGILFFDEINRAPAQVLAPCLQLMTTRRLNDYTLPDGWIVCAAINPANDDYVDARELDPALLSRFCQLKGVADVTSWLRWAQSNGVHASVIDFVQQTPKVFDGRASNPRSWTYVSNHLNLFDKTALAQRPSPTAMLAIVAGHVGNGLALEFFRGRSGKSTKTPSAKEALAAYTGKVQRWVTAHAKDMAALAYLVHEIQVHLQDPDAEQALIRKPPQQRALRDLLEDLPPDVGSPLAELLDNLPDDES